MAKLMSLGIMSWHKDHQAELMSIRWWQLWPLLALVISTRTHQGRLATQIPHIARPTLAANGYTDLSANHALGRGIRIITRAGDIRNNVTLQYDQDSSSEVIDSDAASISTYGNLAQIITTTIKHEADAEDQAAFYLTLRANPQPIFSSITYALTNPELDDGDRDSLLNVFMGQPIALNDLPSNMSAGVFQGFAEGWSFSASFNELSITLLMSPLAYSIQAMAWDDVPINETWATVSQTLTWEYATIVS
jgi:hypothetical protein